MTYTHDINISGCHFFVISATVDKILATGGTPYWISVIGNEYIIEYRDSFGEYKERAAKW